MLRFLEEPIAPVSQFLEETVKVTELFPQEHASERMVERISQRTQTVDAAVPQRLEELQERISERMHEQTVDQPGCYIDKVVDMSVVMQRQVPRVQTSLWTVEVPFNQMTKHADIPQKLLHRQGCCRYACGDAAKGPSNSDGI